MNESLDQPAAADRVAPKHTDPPAPAAVSPGTEPRADDVGATMPVVRSAGSQFLMVFPPIMLPMFLAVADQTIVATALPAIASSLGEIERASWVVVSYLIANTIAAPVYGRLGDTFGRRLMMFVALGIFVFGSVLCAVAPSILVLTAFRVIQGFGGGGLMTLSQALIGEAIPPRYSLFVVEAFLPKARPDFVHFIPKRPKRRPPHERRRPRQTHARLPDNKGEETMGSL